MGPDPGTADRTGSGLIHATCVEIGRCGVLLQGPPGVGKSDLALRLIDQPGFGLSGMLLPARLVSDDQVCVTRSDDCLVATAPDTIAGLLEVRGLGIVKAPIAVSAVLALSVRLESPCRQERFPEAEETFELFGVTLPEVRLDPAFPSAPARLRAALAHLSHRLME